MERRVEKQIERCIYMENVHGDRYKNKDNNNLN
jgi:hypothetical protein